MYVKSSQLLNKPHLEFGSLKLYKNQVENPNMMFQPKGTAFSITVDSLLTDTSIRRTPP